MSDISVRRREARAKRFGTKLVAAGGEPVKLVDRLPDIPEGTVRLEALHLHGTNDMSSGDVLSYFKLYSPKTIEWVNDYSCNVVWEHRDTASRALLGIGRQPVALCSHYDGSTPPVALTAKSAGSAEPTSSDQNQTGEEMEQNQSGEDQNQTEQDLKQNQSDEQKESVYSWMDVNQSGTDLRGTDQSGTDQREKGQGCVEGSPVARSQGCVEGTGGSPTSHAKGAETCLPERECEGPPAKDHCADLQEGGCAEGAEDSPTLQWRYGETHPKAKQLLLRYATAQDVKQKGAAKRSTYYIKYGRPPEISDAKTKEKQDLRCRIGQKRSNQEQGKGGEKGREEAEEGEIMEVDQPSNSLAKRPKPLYSDRPNDLMDVTEMMSASERERVLAELGGDSGRVGLGGGKDDLRRALQQRKKRRNLKLRVGYNPRLVEEKQ